MNKIQTSETFAKALKKKESALFLTTAISAVGYSFVKIVQAISEFDDEAEVSENEETVMGLLGSEEDE